MAKKYDILLIGPANSGKTQIIKSLREEDYPDPAQTDTMVAYTKTKTTRLLSDLGRIIDTTVKGVGIPAPGAEGFGNSIGGSIADSFSGISLFEYGGKHLEEWNPEQIKQQIEHCLFTIFVFNGNDFINELKHFEEGGRISTAIRNYILPQYKEVMDKTKKHKRYRQPFFLATHEDLYTGKSMFTEIIELVNNANRQYRTVSSSDRYSFASILPGHLFCVNAQDSSGVISTIAAIYKQGQKVD